MSNQYTQEERQILDDQKDYQQEQIEIVQQTLDDDKYKKFNTVKNQLRLYKNKILEKFMYEKELKKIEKYLKKHDNEIAQDIINLINDCYEKVDETLFEIGLDKVNNNVAEIIRKKFQDTNISIKHNKNFLSASLKMVEVQEDQDEIEQEEQLQAFLNDNGMNKKLDKINVIKVINEFLDRQQTVSDPVKGLELLSVKKKDKNMMYNFKILKPTFQGNCRIKHYQINVIDINTEKYVKKFQSKSQDFNLEFNYDEFSQYYIIIQIANEIGFSQFKYYYFSPFIIKSQFQKFYYYAKNFDLEQIENLYTVQKHNGINKIDFSQNNIDLDFIDVQCGESNLLLLEDGIVLEWGLSYCKNQQEQDIFEVKNITQIYQSPLSHVIKQIQVGERFCGALDCFGKLFTWGSNEYGQLGLDDFQPRDQPTPVKMDKEIKKFYFNNYNAMCVDKEDQLYVWGKNMSSKIRLNTSNGLMIKQNVQEDQNIPRKLDLKLQLKKVQIGNEFYVLLTDKQQVYTLGLNDQGQLGFPMLNQLFRFADNLIEIPELKGATDIFAGINYTIVKKDKKFYFFGSNQSKFIESINLSYFTPTEMNDLQDQDQIEDLILRSYHIDKILSKELVIEDKNLTKEELDFSEIISYDEYKICYKQFKK